MLERVRKVKKIILEPNIKNPLFLVFFLKKFFKANQVQLAQQV